MLVGAVIESWCTVEVPRLFTLEIESGAVNNTKGGLGHHPQRSQMGTLWGPKIIIKFRKIHNRFLFVFISFFHTFMYHWSTS